MAKLDDQGNYVLSTHHLNDGVPPGEYRVFIKAVRVHGDALEGEKPTKEWLVPEKYASAETSELTATVEPHGGEQRIDFNLPGE